MSTSSDFVSRAAKNFFGIVVALAFVTFLFMAVEARGNASSCVCFYVGDCIFDEEGSPYRYMQCTGSCFTYSDWSYEPRCIASDYPDDFGRI